MITVKKKPLTPNIIWDAGTNSPLCEFKKGVFRTNDKALADKLEALGYEVSGEPDPDVQAENIEDETKANAEDIAVPNKSRKSGK